MQNYFEEIILPLKNDLPNPFSAMDFPDEVRDAHQKTMGAAFRQGSSQGLIEKAGGIVVSDRNKSPQYLWRFI